MKHMKDFQHQRGLVRDSPVSQPDSLTTTAHTQAELLNPKAFLFSCNLSQPGAVAGWVGGTEGRGGASTFLINVQQSAALYHLWTAEVWEVKEPSLTSVAPILLFIIPTPLKPAA